MTLAQLAHSRQNYSYAFLDEFAKRELRRRILKAIAIPG
jgi:alpha-D-ribose 1-methylphosphonate 5-phosphate C-P lyase